MAGKKKEVPVQEEERTIEETFTCLEELLEKMEKADCSLEDSFRYYETGIRMIKSCYEKIDTVEKKLVVLNEEDLEG